MQITNITYIIELIAVISFAISGMIAAKAKDMDLIGIFTVSCVTAFGGGTARDIMLDVTPVYWISHQEFPIIILILSLFYYYCEFLPKIKEFHILIPDTIGLGLFSIAGASLGL